MTDYEIEWISDEEVSIPNYGMTHKGRKLILPAEIAESFVKRKMAKFPTKPSKKEENN